MFDFCNADGEAGEPEGAEQLAEETEHDGADGALCECCERSPRVAKCKFGRECKKALNKITSDENKKLKARPKDPKVVADKQQFDQIRKQGGAPCVLSC